MVNSNRSSKVRYGIVVFLFINMVLNIIGSCKHFQCRLAIFDSYIKAPLSPINDMVVTSLITWKGRDLANATNTSGQLVLLFENGMVVNWFDGVAWSILLCIYRGEVGRIVLNNERISV